MNFRQFISVWCATAIVWPLLLVEADANSDTVSPDQKSAWQLNPLPPVNPESVALGQALFFDPQLSGPGTMSCATCHIPSLHWADGQSFNNGVNGNRLGRHTPSVINSARYGFLFWDGRADSLHAQALVPVRSSEEMDLSLSQLQQRVADSRSYRRAFRRAFGDDQVDMDRIAQALADFQSTLVCDDSRFDQWVAGDDQALSVDEVAGFKLFVAEDKGNCAVCHQPPTFSDDGFHNIGLSSGSGGDPGRYGVVPLRIVHGAFKTSQLRDIAHTAPYFHDGSASTLAEAVRHYVDGFETDTNLSPSFKPANLEPSEIDKVVSFLESLSCDTQRFAGFPVP